MRNQDVTDRSSEEEYVAVLAEGMHEKNRLSEGSWLKEAVEEQEFLTDIEEQFALARESSLQMNLEDFIELCRKGIIVGIHGEIFIPQKEKSPDQEQKQENSKPIHKPAPLTPSNEKPKRISKLSTLQGFARDAYYNLMDTSWRKKNKKHPRHQQFRPILSEELEHKIVLSGPTAEVAEISPVLSWAPSSPEEQDFTGNSDFITLKEAQQLNDFTIEINCRIDNNPKLLYMQPALYSHMGQPRIGKGVPASGFMVSINRELIPTLYAIQQDGKTQTRIPGNTPIPLEEDINIVLRKSGSTISFAINGTEAGGGTLPEPTITQLSRFDSTIGAFKFEGTTAASTYPAAFLDGAVYSMDVYAQSLTDEQLKSAKRTEESKTTKPALVGIKKETSLSPNFTWNPSNEDERTFNGTASDTATWNEISNEILNDFTLKIKFNPDTDINISKNAVLLAHKAQARINGNMPHSGIMVMITPQKTISVLFSMNGQWETVTTISEVKFGEQNKIIIRKAGKNIDLSLNGQESGNGTLSRENVTQNEQYKTRIGTMPFIGKESYQTYDAALYKGTCTIDVYAQYLTNEQLESAKHTEESKTTESVPVEIKKETVTTTTEPNNSNETFPSPDFQWKPSNEDERTFNGTASDTATWNEISNETLEDFTMEIDFTPDPDINISKNAVLLAHKAQARINGNMPHSGIMVMITPQKTISVLFSMNGQWETVTTISEVKFGEQNKIIIRKEGRSVMTTLNGEEDGGRIIPSGQVTQIDQYPTRIGTMPFIGKESYQTYDAALYKGAISYAGVHTKAIPVELMDAGRKIIKITDGLTLLHSGIPSEINFDSLGKFEKFAQDINGNSYYILPNGELYSYPSHNLIATTNPAQTYDQLPGKSSNEILGFLNIKAPEQGFKDHESKTTFLENLNKLEANVPVKLLADQIGAHLNNITPRDLAAQRNPSLFALTNPNSSQRTTQHEETMRAQNDLHATLINIAAAIRSEYLNPGWLKQNWMSHGPMTSNGFRFLSQGGMLVGTNLDNILRIFHKHDIFIEGKVRPHFETERDKAKNLPTGVSEGAGTNYLDEFLKDIPNWLKDFYNSLSSEGAKLALRHGYMDGQYWGSDDLDHEVVVLGDYFDQYVRDESTFLAMRSQLLVVANTFNTDPATALAMINGTTTVVVGEGITDTGGGGELSDWMVASATYNPLASAIEEARNSDALKNMSSTQRFQEVMHNWYDINGSMPDMNGITAKHETYAGKTYLGLLQKLHLAEGNQAEQIRLALVAEGVIGIHANNIMSAISGHTGKVNPLSLKAEFVKVGFNNTFDGNNETKTTPEITEVSGRQIGNEIIISFDGFHKGQDFDKIVVNYNGKLVEASRNRLYVEFTVEQLEDVMSACIIPGQTAQVDLELSAYYPGEDDEVEKGNDKLGMSLSGFEVRGVNNSEIVTSQELSALPDTPENAERRAIENAILQRMHMPVGTNRETNSDNWEYALGSGEHDNIDKSTQRESVFYEMDLNRGAGDDDKGEDVFAVNNGTVIRSPNQTSSSYNTVDVRYSSDVQINGNPISILWRTRYLHMNNIQVNEGDHVTNTTHIGDVGDVGSLGQWHLHFEVWYTYNGVEYRLGLHNWLAHMGVTDQAE